LLRCIGRDWHLADIRGTATICPLLGVKRTRLAPGPNVCHPGATGAEKGVDFDSQLMTLQGDQYDPAYMKLNPNAVVKNYWTNRRSMPNEIPAG
jgi:hypothetical protein